MLSVLFIESIVVWFVMPDNLPGTMVLLKVEDVEPAFVEVSFVEPSKSPEKAVPLNGALIEPGTVLLVAAYRPAEAEVLLRAAVTELAVGDIAKL